MLQSPEQHHHLAFVVAHVPLPSAIIMRAWTNDDFTAIQQLSAAEGWLTPTTRPEEALRAWQQSWPALVVVEGDTVVGFVRALTDTYVTIYIADLLVAAAWRGHGLGRSLLEVCQRLYPTTRLDLLSTDTAHSFYKAQGFRGIPGYRKSVV